MTHENNTLTPYGSKSTQVITDEMSVKS